MDMPHARVMGKEVIAEPIVNSDCRQLVEAALKGFRNLSRGVGLSIAIFVLGSVQDDSGFGLGGVVDEGLRICNAFPVPSCSMLGWDDGSPKTASASYSTMFLPPSPSFQVLVGVGRP